MKHLLKWKREQKTTIFTCEADGALVPVDIWAKHLCILPDGSHACLAPLLQLLEDEIVEPSQDALAVAITDSVLASLDKWQTKGLGLPPHAPVRLSLVSQGPLSSPNFQIRYGFTFSDGLPASGATIYGAFFHHNKRAYILSDPIFTIKERIDEYMASPIKDMDDRFLWWSKLAEIIPAESSPSGFLKQIHAVRPESFSLDFKEDNGRLRILPRFVTSKDLEIGSELHEDVLPAAISSEFQEKFARQIQPTGRYALHSNWFIVLPPALRAAIEVVHHINGASESDKRQFLHNPRAIIRAHIEDRYNDLTENVIETIFRETPLFLSERIKHLGVWEPKAGFYIKTHSGEWFPTDAPPKSLLLPIGQKGQLVEVAPQDLPTLQEALVDAQTQKRDTASYLGTMIPASESTIAMVDRATRMFVPRAPDAPQDATLQDKKGNKVVPIIFDHIEELGVQIENNGTRQAFDLPLPLKPQIRLHAHQEQGIKWLQAHWLNASPGALLADDMGLGKTIQTLAFLGWVRAQQQAGAANLRPFLIVAPTGLLHNWEEEADRFLQTPGLASICRAHGQDLKQLTARGTLAAAKELESYGVVLTTYETLRDRIEVFIAVHWSVTVFDEAQKIKNPKAMVTDMAKSLKSEFSLSLTGTPVENSLADLWCILDAVHPMRLETFKDFAKNYMPNGSPTQETLTNLKEELSTPKGFPSLLRRTKDTHWEERPTKIQNIVPVIMSDTQAQAYQQALTKATSDAGRPGAILEALQHIRNISLHPYTSAWGTIETDEYIRASARLQGTIEILKKIKTAGEKALIFIEFKQMQMVLTELLQQLLGCDQVLIINGEVSGPKRQKRIHTFQNSKGFDVILLSPKAAGVGLTLTSATHVIHLTRWWNPAIEDQCTDRAYRIGQNKNVTVHYPQAIHPQLKDASFDIKLHQLLEKKRALSRDLLAPSLASHNELEELLSNLITNTDYWSSTANDKLLNEIDIMEPLQFEGWVANCFGKMGYAVQMTPRSGDGGADIIATVGTTGRPWSLIVQCKHTQSPDHPLGHEGIDEVLKAQNRYLLSGQVRCILATNSAQVSAKTKSMAEQKGVSLILRCDLSKLERGISLL